jgi:hypothetical protein
MIFLSLLSRSTTSGRKEVFMNTIRFVPTWLHACFDYIGGVTLIAAPFVFGFASVGGAAVILPIVLGIGLILYSLLTNYELGLPVLKFIPMPVHLIIDVVAAALLAVSPFVFGFSNHPLNVWLPHVVSGIGVIVLVLVTQTRPYMRRVKAVA